LDLTKSYSKRLEEEETKTAEELIVANVGKLDPKKHLEASVEELMTANISQCLGTMLATVVF
jgi:26S proteasome regulatory subunit N11